MKSTLLVWISSLSLFFLPIKGLAIAVGLAILVDTIFGIWRTVKINGWKSFTSRKLSRLVSKSLLYLSVLYLIFPIDFYLINEIVKHFAGINVDYLATKAVALTLVYIELKSMKESFNDIFGINVWNELKELLSRTKEIKSEIEDMTKD